MSSILNPILSYVLIEFFAGFLHLSPRPLANPRLQDANPVQQVALASRNNTIKSSPVSIPIAPGLSLPQDFPPLAAPSSQPSKPPSRLQRKAIIPNTVIKPVVPNISTSSTKPTALTKVLPLDEQPTLDGNAALSCGPPASDLGKRQKPGKEVREDAAQTLKDTKADLPIPDQEGFSEILSRPLDKKQRPGKLDITAAKDVSKRSIEKEIFSEANNATNEASGAAGLSQPSTPATAVSQTSAYSAITHSLPRNMRVSRGDTQPASPGFLASNINSKRASRRPSIASLHRPGSAAEERISDNASLTSTSMSRANSPPGKVGSAPVRQITKSQQKKERQARAKLSETTAKEEEPETKIEEVQVPIVGRKKKAKKEKTQGTAGSTPTVTRPTSPVHEGNMMEDKSAPLAAPVTPVIESKNGAPKAALEVKEPDTLSSPATPTVGNQQRAALTAASIFAQLQKAGEISASAAELFKSIPGVNHRVESLEMSGQIVYSDEQTGLLDRGEMICIDKGPNNHVVVLPNRTEYPCLTAEQASRFIELRKCYGEVQSSALTSGIIPETSPISTSVTVLGSNRETSSKLENPFAGPTARPGQAVPSVQSSGTTAVRAAQGALPKEPIALSVPEAEQTLALRKKETEGFEKRLNGILKKNKRLLFGNH